MAANQDIFDDFIKHQIQLQRLSNGQAARILESLDGTNEALAEAIYSAVINIKETSNLTKGRSAFYETLKTRIAYIRGSAIDTSLEDYTKELEKLIAHETALTTAIYETNIPLVLAYKTPATKYLKAILTDGQFFGKSIEEYFTQFTQNDIDRILQSVKSGINQGLPTERIVSEVVGSSNMGYKNGAMGKSRKSIRSMVRTITGGVGNSVRGLWNMANKDILAYEIYSAVLDGRTTYICASLDGEQFEVGVGPQPPLHFNCRSMRLGIVDVLAKDGIMGNRPYVRDTRTARQRRIDFRKQAKEKVGATKWKEATLPQRRNWINTEKNLWQDANIGKTKGYKTFQQWFDDQPASFQTKYLGPTRYQAYKDGSSLSEFVRIDGSNFTLDELIENDVL